MRTLLRAGLGVVAMLVLGCGGRAATVDLDRILADHVAALSPDGRYSDPGEATRTTARTAFGLLLRNDTARADGLLDGIGFAATRGPDFTLYRAGHGWGLLLVDRSAPVRALIEVPHPGYDLDTDLLGLALYRALPGSALLVAGAHRRAAGGAADVAHNDRSMFQAFSVAAAAAGVPQLQVHGFAQSSLPGADAVVSTGAGPHHERAERIAAELAARDLRVCRAWTSRCVGLEGTTNVQGAAAAEYGADFVHLELGWSLRRDRAGREHVRDAVVAAWKP